MRELHDYVKKIEAQESEKLRLIAFFSPCAILFSGLKYNDVFFATSNDIFNLLLSIIIYQHQNMVL